MNSVGPDQTAIRDPKVNEQSFSLYTICQFVCLFGGITPSTVRSPLLKLEGNNSFCALKLLDFMVPNTVYLTISYGCYIIHIYSEEELHYRKLIMMAQIVHDRSLL